MKKKSKIYKLVSSLLAIVLMLSIHYAPIQASESSSGIVILDKGYEIRDGVASDWIKFIDCDGQTAILKGVAASNNSYSLTLEKTNQIKQYPVGHVDYEKYVFDLLHPQNIIPHTTSPNTIAPYGYEITYIQAAGG